MVKVPATPAGIEAIEELAAAGVTLNITLIFTMRQYEAARDAVWRGVQRLPNTDGFKSAYSVFVSRVDAYGKSELTDLSAEAAGLLGIVNAKQIWQANQEFWKQHPTKLQQEIIFASTGTKDPADPAWKYVEALAGSDIQTNPPSTNDQAQASGVEFTSRITELPGAEILDEIERIVDWEVLENVLMDQGISKFANPQKELLALIAEKRSNLE